MFKIKYSINLLPAVGMYIEENSDNELGWEYVNGEDSISTLFTESTEIEIFETEAVQQVIEYRWKTFGLRFHIASIVFTFFYQLLLNIYIA